MKYASIVFAVVSVLGCNGEMSALGGNGPSTNANQTAGPGPNQTNGPGPSQAATQASQAAGNQTTGTPAINTATLSWDANSEPDLAGYKVYHSQESQMYTLGMPEATVPVGTLTHVSADLAPGRHYFAVTAYDTSGNESALSEEVFKDIE